MRVYTAFGENFSILAAKTILGLRAPADAAIRILRVELNQSGTTTVGMQRVEFVKQAATLPTFASSSVIGKLTDTDPTSKISGNTNSAAGTSGTNASAEGGGTRTVIWPGAFEVVRGLLWVPTSAKEEIILPAGDASLFGIYLPAAPTSSGNWNALVVFEEI